jgi:Uma2 family endonuclease
MATEAEWTAEMVYALPEDGKRYEVLDGELVVTPAPSWGHQSVVARLWRLLDDHVRAYALGYAYLAPADIEFSPRRLLQPDLFVVPPTADGKRAHAWGEVRRLLLAVEVLSPSTARVDRVRKRALYLEEGVPEYWIVDPDGRCVERWRSGDARPEVVDERLVWAPVDGVAPLDIDLQVLFEGALE